MATRKSRSRNFVGPTAQQLRSFVETVQRGGIAGAAAHLGLSPPTIRQQIRILEQLFGEPLFVATARSLGLTPAGQVLADLTQGLASEFATLSTRFHERRNAQPPKLRVLATPRIFLEDLPQVIEEYRQRNPIAGLVVREVTERRIREQLEYGDADLALVVDPSERRADLGLPSRLFEVQEVYPLTIALVTPRDHPLSRKRQIKLADLVRFPFVNSPNDLEAIGVLHVLSGAGLTLLRQTVETFVTANVRASVLAGYGIGLIPKPHTDPGDPELKEQSLTHLFAVKRVCAISRKGRAVTPLAASLLAILRSQFGK
ncbi:MAG: LysR family transcriptional regulator [Gemmataceae bacterium]